jgi:hypothetical protein
MAKAADYVPYDGPLVTRAQAKAAGLPRYFTGKPCPRGHVVERTTANGTCRLCSNRMSGVARKNNPEKYIGFSREWKRRNKDKVAAYAKAEKARDPDMSRKRGRRWSRKNQQARRAYSVENAEAIRARVKQWAIDNPEQARANRRNRRARVAAAEGYHTGAEIKALMEKQRGRCVYCFTDITTQSHADQII